MASLALGLVVLGCRGESTASPSQTALLPSSSSSAETPPPEPAAPDPAPEAGPERTPYTPPSSLGSPIATRAAERSRMVYVEPNADSDQRGRIPSGESFHVYAELDGRGCKRAWAQVGVAAWICLDKTRASEDTPLTLPSLEDAAIVPFTYGRHRDHDKAQTPAIPVYGSTQAWREGEAAVEEWPAYGSYAFTRVRRREGHQLLTTLDRKLVVGDDFELFEPSEFAGLTLAEAPALEGDQVHAWAVRWKSLVHAEPDPASESIARIRYHDPLLVAGEVVEVEAEDEADREWIAVVAQGSTPAGWIRIDNIRRYLPVPPPEPVLAGQVTIDVDLDEQVLSVWLEDEAVFATLISSGKQNDRTPTGLYRVTTKRAHGKMSSREGSSRPYFVEAVPWILYFEGRYAFHTAYWHDMFGHRMSHGCVNLSPRDAKHVFELSTPALAPGWLLVHEHAQDPGTLVRIRREGEPLPDRREPFE